MEELPHSSLVEVIGLIELINDFGGRVALDDLRYHTGMDLSSLLEVVEGAEMLGLVNVRGGILILTRRAKNLLRKNAEERQDYLSRLISRLPLFKAVKKVLEAKGGKMEREKLRDFLSILLDNTKNIDSQVSRIIEWGRYAGILDYDGERGVVYLEGTVL